MNDLEINLKSKNMNFEVSTSLYDTMYVVCPIFAHINCVCDDNSLYITSDKKIKSSGILKLYSLNLFSNKIKIYLPNSMRVGVKANLTDGNICLNNLVIEDAFINNLHGDVVIKESNVSNLKINGNDSKIRLSNVSGYDINIYSEKGDIGINGILSENISAITNDGNINLKLFKGDKRVISSSNTKHRKILKLSAPHGKIVENFCD